MHKKEMSSLPRFTERNIAKFLLTVPPRRAILEEFLEAASPADCHSTAYITKTIKRSKLTKDTLRVSFRVTNR